MNKIEMIKKIDTYTSTRLPTITKARMLFYSKKRLGRIYYVVKNYHVKYRRKIIAHWEWESFSTAPVGHG